ncbi:unnamed protein product [Oncorhynchus mykiss]|uniref:SERTA domain-containing protein n=1 Tax=Oncorhynchus mykiss TaxID=8022 RepID=A0A060YFL7_ONCMY|nr:unnamed protein product [Oncorhynchus mykiss]
MLGNGVKRKLDEDGLEEGKALLTSAARAAGSHSRINYTLQRQTVLNISLMKLYGPARTPATEPALQRRVLINNVIRRIHHEFKEEGGAGLRALFFADSFSSALEEIEELCPIAVTTSTTSSLPLSPPPSPQPPPSLPAGMDMKEEGRTYNPKDKDAPADLSPSSGGFLTDFALDDILFTDIDTSIYSGGGVGSPPLAQNQPFKMDLAELDHIMEVLVGS